MKVAAIQMVSGIHLQTNLERAATLLAEAAASGAELAVLPEYFCLLGQRDTDKLQIQEGGFNPKCNKFNARNRVAGSCGPSARHRPQWVCGGPRSFWGGR